MTLIEKITEALNDMDTGELVAVWNDYCRARDYCDDEIYDMDTLPELFDTSTADGVWNLLNRFYFGHDENCAELSSANPNRDYFKFDGYANILSSDYPTDWIEIDDIAEYVVENEDSLYNRDLQEILDEYEQEEEA